MNKAEQIAGERGADAGSAYIEWCEHSVAIGE
jgi:hypothetical protein